MQLGRSIRIYLDGGEVSGIRHAELVNWTGQALHCPRSRFRELASGWENVVSRPGVYFLVGADLLAERELYIGEAEDTLVRLGQHLRDAERDWTEAIVFTSKDENLTKAHVKYLESRLVERAKAANRYRVLNKQQPTAAGLPRADQDAMEEFLMQMPILLGVLGHRVLDPLIKTDEGEESARTFTYAVKDAKAVGAVTDDGFVIFKGSTALKNITETMTPGYVAYKKELIASGKLTDAGPVLRFNDDVLFNSPSAAAAVVYGNNANGRVLWRTADGRTLKEVEEDAAGA